MTKKTTSDREELLRRFVQANVHACMTTLAERLFEHEPELLDEADNRSAPVCPECGERVDDTSCASCGVLFEDEEPEHEPQEIYEWWSVDDHLGERLAERGEPVHRDFYGHFLWGRTTTGQAIWADAVIAEIYDDLG